MATTFNLFRTKAGRILLTTEERLRNDQLANISQYLEAWSKGPEGAFLLIPDCTYMGEVDETGVHLRIADASPDEQTPTAGGKSEAVEPMPEDAGHFSAAALVAHLGDRALSAHEVARSTGWDPIEIQRAFQRDARIEEVEAGAGRWQLTDSAAADLDRSNA